MSTTSTGRRTAVVLGASGLVGSHLVPLLRDDPAYARIRLLGRRPLGLATPDGRIEEQVVDLGAPPEGLFAVDDVFCCLGTTIKKAGSQEAFRKVDHDYPLACARAALAAGAKQLLVVTAVGASARSGLFYNRVKGELEDALRGLAFPEGVAIFHPSMLLGERQESRPGETVGQAVFGALRFAFVGGLAKYRAITGDQVARALWHAATHDGKPGVRVYEGDTLFAAAR